MKRVALITGAAGGIGLATARLFAEKGWLVVGVDHKQTSESAGMTQFIQADVAQTEAWELIHERIIDRCGQLDTLVHNAAIQICKPLVETSIDEWDATMATNVRSVFLGSRCAYPLLQRSGGSIVNISSVHANATSAGLAAYAASKGALLSLTRAMALEFGPSVRVNAVLPGAIDTPMLFAGLSRGHLSGHNIPAMVQELGKKHVLGRTGKPGEVARVIYFLADQEQSTFMTGQTITVDGGAIARLSTE
ncbi:NAD(P)-dependent dehydrogenase, short-chain alcohol dehydrogenase family [Syntrophus gentianae]|uniref:NAD(P)-dependent dehydrogenase, short-chain alcohol dehydrogenase family n=1 Tax=Syntrophus gentianae TaxID=43775 RepID=A0A1H7X7N9_9BACT|nr:SDR family oxidoreductase [Syntrophus gentianae]SEM29675.1 NAD(P)-dependent dehydrogenase, short-chain alcohol dehydrogenase family [Syntrophus gentianae]